MNGSLVQVSEYLIHWHGQPRPKGEIQSIICGRGLQFEVEATADLLPQRHTPGPVDLGSEGCVNHQLHAAALIKEPLGNHFVLRWDHAEDPLALFYVGDQLPAGLLVDPGFRHHPVLRLGVVVQSLVYAFSEIRYLL